MPKRSKKTTNRPTSKKVFRKNQTKRSVQALLETENNESGDTGTLHTATTLILDLDISHKNKKETRQRISL